VLCTRRLARRVAPELRRFGLDQLAAGFGIRNRARHRAMGDAEATAEALLVLLERARERHGVRTLADLVRLEAGPPGPRPA
jgi:DNA polymerase-3 subunit epsilon